MNGVRQRRPNAPVRARNTQQWLPTVIKVVAVFVITAVVIIASLAGWKAYNLATSVTSGNDLHLGAVVDDPLDNVPTPVSTTDGATDILLVGSDSRTDAQGNPLTPEEIDMLRAGDIGSVNTDTIIVARIADDGSAITAVSIPRDSYITDRIFGNMKINAVYATHMSAARERLQQQGAADIEAQAATAGRQALIEAVGSLTGINIDHYAEVGLLGFVLLTDAVGGVDVCLNNPVNEPLSGANFAAGPQTLSGADGLSFVRQRYGLPLGDLDRITRQQAYMSGLARNILSAGTLTDPSSLNNLMAAVERSVVLDSSWNIWALAAQLQGIQGADIRFQTIPVVTIDGTGDNGESVVEVDVGQVQQFFRQVLGTDEDSGRGEVSSAISAKVFNASDVPGAAEEMAARLSDAGVVVTEVGNAAPSLGTVPRVIAAPDNVAAGEVAATVGLPLEISEQMQGTSVTVVVSPVPHPEPVAVAVDVPEPANLVDASGAGPVCVN